jgi:NAD(P)-dependent dehydrogenase (short-subunit alcohol dehydrogenase family)
MADKFDLTSKVAIVTGGGKGIGKAISKSLAESGAKVVLAARTEEDLNTTAREIVENGGEAFPRVTDLSKPDEITGLIKDTLDKYQTVDILVNNAARSVLRPLMDLRDDGVDKIFNVNLKAPFLLARECAKIMSQKGGGSIVNITTVGAERGGPMMGMYMASKAALKMLTMCMAIEWASMNIRVNAVGPGMTKTDFSKPIWMNPEMESQLTAKIPMGRLGEPQDIVAATLFLCSQGAQYITGQTIYVDGGGLATS